MSVSCAVAVCGVGVVETRTCGPPFTTRASSRRDEAEQLGSGQHLVQRQWLQQQADGLGHGDWWNGSRLFLAAELSNKDHYAPRDPPPPIPALVLSVIIGADPPLAG